MKLVKVYRNLRDKCYSVQYRGKVIAHVDSIVLKRAAFVVSEAGRQRVIKSKRKNVHAFVRGYVSMREALDKGMRVSYNPYVAGNFAVGEIPIHHADEVHLTKRGVFIPPLSRAS